MPVPQLVPPGHLDQHGLLVALTPALLACGAAAAAWIVGDRRTQPGLTAARALVAVNLLGALGIAAAFLLPRGAAAAYDQPLAGGLLRVGWIPTGSACALGAWACWRFFPRVDPLTGLAGRSWAWPLRVAAALLMPVLALPPLALAAEGDAPPLADGRQRLIARAVVVAAASAGVLGGMLAGLAPQWCWFASAVSLLTSAVVSPGPWRVPMAVAGLAIVAPAI
jgi:hypothetical protein